MLGRFTHMATNSTSSVYSAHAIGTIWELPPAQQAQFIADRSGSFCGIDYMHTKYFGWTVTIGHRSFSLPRSFTPSWIVLSLGGCLLLVFILRFLRRSFRSSRHDNAA